MPQVNPAEVIYRNVDTLTWTPINDAAESLSPKVWARCGLGIYNRVGEVDPSYDPESRGIGSQIIGWLILEIGDSICPNPQE